MLHSEQITPHVRMDDNANRVGSITRNSLKAGGLFGAAVLIAGCGVASPSGSTAAEVTSPGPTASPSMAPDVPGATPTPTESLVTEIPDPLGTAEPGQHGDYVGYIQGMLIVVNCLPEGDDDEYMAAGRYSQTSEAINRFQKGSDLTVTGRIVETDPTETALISSAGAEEKVCTKPAPRDDPKAPQDPPETPIPVPTCSVGIDGTQRPINPYCPPRPDTTAQTP